ncbi:hypothetical protein GGR54DRAFT_105488 [Hypoxylon sp. NC1633]|nr:hypothetical protein GGR54DRAFT_105488 [Hypoxylon sp. NC1633]
MSTSRVPIPPRSSSIHGSPSKLTDTFTGLSTTSSPGSPANPVIPARSSSNRQKRPWQPGDAKRSRSKLEADIQSLNNEIGNKVKRMKPSTSYDSDFWTTNANLSQLCQHRAGLESDLQFLNYKEASRDDVLEDDWRTSEQAQNLELQITAYRQAEEIAQKQASRLQQSRTGLLAVFFSLFTGSPQGLNIKAAGVGRRDASAQSNMFQQMRDKYCPDAPEGLLWDPIIGRWELKNNLHAAHLYAWRQVESMNAIFGLGARDDVFSPVNGLFMLGDIEKALDQGLIALVPDVDLEPKDSRLPNTDLAERNQRLRDWKKSQIKEYKVIVLDHDNKQTKTPKWRDDHGELQTLAKLDGRPLKFHTDFRPRARYVWWTFMNAILQTSWRQKPTEKNVLRQEVAKATRYWGTRGRYVKKNMLRGFVDELGQDIESILENADEDGDTGDADPVALAVLASETVFRTQEAAKGDGDDDEEEEYDEDEDEDEDDDVY